MRPDGATLPRAIDCDVHCAPASMDVLLPVSRRLLALVHRRRDDPRSAQPRATRRARRRRGGPAPAASRSSRRCSTARATRCAMLSCSCSTACTATRTSPPRSRPRSTTGCATSGSTRDPRLRASIVVSTLDIPAARRTRSSASPATRASSRSCCRCAPTCPTATALYRPLYAAAAAARPARRAARWGRAGAAPTPTGSRRPTSRTTSRNAHIAQVQLMSLVAEGVFERSRSCGSCCSSAASAGCRSLLWRFDKDWKGVWREVPWVKGAPVGVIRRHVRLTTAPAQLPQPRRAEVAAGRRDGRPGDAALRERPPARPRRVGRRAAARPRAPPDVEAILRGNAAAFYRRSVA